MRLITKCFIDYDRELALVAEHIDKGGARHIAGVARMIRSHSGNDAEVAFIVADQDQKRGLGCYLLDCIVNIARKEGISRLEGTLLAENLKMRDLFVRAGFHVGVPQERVITATRDLEKLQVN